MISKPIIPMWIMIIVTIILLIVVIMNKKRLLSRIIIIALLFMINMRIMLPDGKADKVVSNVDVLFVVDNSISMIAEDYKGNNTRFSGVRTNTEYIMNNLAGGSFALIAFNNVSNILVPFVDDPDITKNAITDLKPKNSLYAKGTTLNVAYDDMEMLLSDVEDRENRKVALFFLSDGEITAEDKTLKSFAKLKDYIDCGAVMGYGTTSGGKMKADDHYYYKDKSGYMLDKTTSYPYEVALSKMNETNLKKLADDMGIKYIHMNNNTDVDSVLNELKAAAFEESDEEEDVYKDTYYIYAIILLFFLGFEFVYIRRSLL